jgi:plasmid stabilization system protein ParE
LLGVVRSISRTVSVTSAVNWRRRIEAAIQALADDAHQWPEADEAASLNRNLRCRLFGRRRHVYRILFTIDGNTVTVHRVRHAAMDTLTHDDF